MSRRLWWFLPLLAAACTGLYFDRGNAFPCDFSQGPGVRDQACVAGDVCGSNNLCQRYIYEGPRFENGASVPGYGAGTSEGVVIHPLVITQNIDAIAAELPLSRGGSNWIFSNGDLIEVTRDGRVLTSFPQFELIKPLLVQAAPRYLQPFYSSPGPVPNTVAVGLDGGFLLLPPVPVLLRNANVIAGELRLVDSPWRELSTPVAFRDDSIGFVVHNGNDWEFAPIANVSSSPGAPVLDIAGIRQPQQLWLIALRNDSVSVLSVVAPTHDANPADAGRATDAGVFALVPLAQPVAGMLRSDREGRIIAAVRRETFGLGPAEVSRDVLSTWQVTIDVTGPRLERAWPDCQPCARAGQTIRLISASVATGVPSVEVVCASPLTEPTTLRVKGSVALTPTDACLTEAFDSPIPFARFVKGPPSFWQSQTGLRVGGPNGALWAGDTISGLRPAFLDRVPRDVTVVQTPDASTLAAITSDSLMVQESSDLLDAVGRERPNGFRRILPRQLGLADDGRLLSFVRDTPGWGITSEGDVLKTRFTDTGVTTFPGPHLVTSSGQPIRDSIGGEAFVSPADGGLQGFFVAADDSLYFVSNPRQFITTGPIELPTLTPALTPEPSVPIRSLTLERTALGTNGINTGRGYLVTSRNVFAWQLMGTPARWTATPLALGGGEPVEVWFDAPRSALGRAGYRNGEVYSLPGGYQLAYPLESDGGMPTQVIDYENLGGWPVAYASSGLFIAGWDLVDGKLQNRFPDGGINRPMTWREITLPDGSRPWMKPQKAETKPGKLFVTKEPATDAGEPQHLLLFLDEQVVEVASTIRQ